MIKATPPPGQHLRRRALLGVPPLVAVAVAVTAQPAAAAAAAAPAAPVSTTSIECLADLVTA